MSFYKMMSTKGTFTFTTENRVFFSTCEILCMSLSPTKSECENVFYKKKTKRRFGASSPTPEASAPAAISPVALANEVTVINREPDSHPEEEITNLITHSDDGDADARGAETSYHVCKASHQNSDTIAEAQEEGVKGTQESSHSINRRVTNKVSPAQGGEMSIRISAQRELLLKEARHGVHTARRDRRSYLLLLFLFLFAILAATCLYIGG